MRPRLGRLRARPEFLQVAAAGRKWSTPGLVLQAGRADSRRPGDEAEEAAPSASSETARQQDAIRVGFTASRKVGSAVARNRAKRRLRALAAELLPALGKPGTDYVLIGRPATVSRPFDLLRQDLEQAVQAVERRRAGREGSRSRDGSRGRDNRGPVPRKGGRKADPRR